MAWKALQEPIGTIQSECSLLNKAPISFAGTLTPLGTAALQLTLPTTNAGGSGIRIVTNKLSAANRRKISFAHTHATDADGKTSTCRIFGLRPLTSVTADVSVSPTSLVRGDHAEYLMPCLLDIASIVGGGNAIPADSRIVERTSGILSINFCDTIASISDYTRNNSALVYHEGADNIAVCEFDAEGFERLVIECVKGTAACIFVFMEDI